MGQTPLTVSQLSVWPWTNHLNFTSLSNLWFCCRLIKHVHEVSVSLLLNLEGIAVIAQPCVLSLKSCLSCATQLLPYPTLLPAASNRALFINSTLCTKHVSFNVFNNNSETVPFISKVQVAAVMWNSFVLEKHVAQWYGNEPTLCFSQCQGWQSSVLPP